MPGITLVWFMHFALGLGSATFQIVSDPPTAVGGFTVDLFDPSARDKQLREENFQGSTGVIHFLPAGRYMARLEMNRHFREVEFSVERFEDAHVDVAFHRVNLHGTVRIGDKGAAASLEFLNSFAEILKSLGDANPSTDADATSLGGDLNLSSDRHVSTSDADGNYQANLWPEESYSAHVESAETSRPAWSTERILVAKGGGRHDFDLTGTWITVRILDDSDGLPIPDSNLIWMDEGGAEFRTAGPEGRVRIDSVKPGNYTFTAKAEAYEKAQATFAVPENAVGDEHEIRLKKKGAEKRFRVLLPDGSPAQGVTVRYAADPTSLGAMGLRIDCDESATCSAPSDLDARSMLLLYRQDVGLTIVTGDIVLSGNPLILKPAGGILEIHLRATGNAPPPTTVYSASVTVDGVTLGDYQLQSIDSASGGEGMFGLHTFKGYDSPLLIHGLPIGRIRVVITAQDFGEKKDVGSIQLVSRVASDPVDVQLPSEPVTIGVR